MKIEDLQKAKINWQQKLKNASAPRNAEFIRERLKNIEIELANLASTPSNADKRGKCTISEEKGLGEAVNGQKLPPQIENETVRKFFSKTLNCELTWFPIQEKIITADSVIFTEAELLEMTASGEMPAEQLKSVYELKKMFAPKWTGENGYRDIPPIPVRNTAVEIIEYEDNED